MKEAKRYIAPVAVFLVSQATFGQTPVTTAPQKAPQMQTIAAKSGPAQLNPAEEAVFRSMVAQHQRIRSRLPVAYQVELDQLTVQVKNRLFAAPLEANLLVSAAQIVRGVMPGLAPPEVTSLAEYVLGGIAAAGEMQGALRIDTRSANEKLVTFMLRYVQLQSSMQNENRSYTAISNIMKTKHDTVKNSISNIR